ncbi:MAG: permease [Candidatus Latescibacteria bacterium]|nr:permease [Candidatus Latescibacterota bacterium]
MLISLTQSFLHYLVEILPALAIGFLLSGIIHEFIPESIVSKYLSSQGVKPIFLLTLIGIFLPICCFGTLPLAVAFYKKGIKLGPILAFLVATPATSISAPLVTYRLFGITFTIYIFAAVIVMGLLIGMIGNLIIYKPKSEPAEENCPHCRQSEDKCGCHSGTGNRIKSILKFAFIDMPKEIGLLTLVGILLAAIVSTFTPIGVFIRQFLSGGFSYVFALIFGIVMYFCSTSSPPFVHAMIKQGMPAGAGMVLLLIGPITSYATILVVSKKFGIKVMLIYLSVISVVGLAVGCLFSLIP